MTLIKGEFGCKQYDINTTYPVRTKKQIQIIVNCTEDSLSGLRKHILSP